MRNFGIYFNSAGQVFEMPRLCKMRECGASQREDSAKGTKIPSKRAGRFTEEREMLVEREGFASLIDEKMHEMKKITCKIFSCVV